MANQTILIVIFRLTRGTAISVERGRGGHLFHLCAQNKFASTQRSTVAKIGGSNVQMGKPGN